MWVSSFEGRGQVNMPAFGNTCPGNPRDITPAMEGTFGAPAVPECFPHGYLNANNTCTCWDETIYKGTTCGESCVSYCSGRGVCRANNSAVCDCWDPVRWKGNRCEISVCGKHGVVIGGDWTAGVHIAMLWLCLCTPVCLNVHDMTWYRRMVVPLLCRTNGPCEVWLCAGLVRCRLLHPERLCARHAVEREPAEVCVQPRLQWQ